MASVAPDRQKWVIEPVGVGIWARLQELARFRRVIWFFAVRAIKDRYSKTSLGMFWFVLRPLMPIFINTLIFGSLLQLDKSIPVPYFLFFLTGSSCWRMFERATLWATRSLDQQRALIKKVYFPRLAAPLAAIAPAVMEFLPMVALLVLAAGYYWWKDGVMYLRFGPAMLLSIVPVALTLFLSLSIGLWTSVWQTRHKDVQYSQRYFLQFWHYATPVLYPMSKVYESKLFERVPPEWHFLPYLNPMAGIVEMYKWSMLGIGDFPGYSLLWGFPVIGVVFAGGLFYFTHSEAGAVDRL